MPYSDDVCLVTHELIDSLDVDPFDINSEDLGEAKSGQDFKSIMRPPLVISAHTRCAIDSFRLWLEGSSTQQPFLLLGPEGCGKR